MFNFFNQKGGAGKTTLLYNCAKLLVPDHRVLAVDADLSQQSITLALAGSDNINVVSRADFNDKKAELREKNDVILVDLAGFINPQNAPMSRNVIMPVRASLLDVASFYQSYEQLTKLMASNKTTGNVLVVVNALGNTSLEKDYFAELSKFAEEKSLAIITTPNTNLYRKALDAGVSLHAFKSEYGYDNALHGLTQINNFILKGN